MAGSSHSLSTKRHAATCPSNGQILPPVTRIDEAGSRRRRRRCDVFDNKSRRRVHDCIEPVWVGGLVGWLSVVRVSVCRCLCVSVCRCRLVGFVSVSVGCVCRLVACWLVGGWWLVVETHLTKAQSVCPHYTTTMHQFTCGRTLGSQTPGVPATPPQSLHVQPELKQEELWARHLSCPGLQDMRGKHHKRKNPEM